jgi:hypothetical protein
VAGCKRPFQKHLCEKRAPLVESGIYKSGNQVATYKIFFNSSKKAMIELEEGWLSFSAKCNG